MFINPLLLVTILSLAVLLFYYAYFFFKLNTYKANDSAFGEPISIIV